MRLKTAAIIVTAVLTAGCTIMGERNSVAEPATAYSVAASAAAAPVWLAAPRPGLSAVGKDYLFVGPMSVNRNGQAQSYLWFALGTTLDREIMGAPRPAVQSVLLIVDGTPMTFDLVPWDDTNRPTPFQLTIENYAGYAARITQSQLRQLAGAAELAAYVTDPGGRSPRYAVVRGEAATWHNGQVSAVQEPR
jgi:hypothetical protein